MELVESDVVEALVNALGTELSIEYTQFDNRVKCRLSRYVPTISTWVVRESIGSDPLASLINAAACWNVKFQAELGQQSGESETVEQPGSVDSSAGSQNSQSQEAPKKKAPTSQALKFAKRIADRLGVVIPAEVESDARSLSNWIDINKSKPTPPKGEGESSQKQTNVPQPTPSQATEASSGDEKPGNENTSLKDGEILGVAFTGNALSVRDAFVLNVKNRSKEFWKDWIAGQKAKTLIDLAQAQAMEQWLNKSLP